MINYNQYQLTKKENMKYALQGLLICILIGLVFYDSILATILLTPFLYWYRKFMLKRVRQQRKWRLNLEFLDGLQSLSAAFKAGYSSEHAVGEAIKDLKLLYEDDSMILKEFTYIVNQINMNISVEQAFYELAIRSGVEDILSFSEVFATAKRMGGDLIKIIQITCETIQDKLEVKREILTLIAGKRLEANVMKVIPAGIILYLRITSPNYLSYFYHNIAGMLLMTILLGVYLAAILWIDKIMCIEV